MINTKMYAAQIKLAASLCGGGGGGRWGAQSVCKDSLRVCPLAMNCFTSYIVSAVSSSSDSREQCSLLLTNWVFFFLSYP